jgi:hypothetical protein
VGSCRRERLRAGRFTCQGIVEDEMVGGMRAMTTAQLPPNCEEAIRMLRFLFSICTYNDLDVDLEEDAKTLLARRQVAEASLQRLEIELGFRKPPSKPKKRPAIRAEKTKRRS